MFRILKENFSTSYTIDNCRMSRVDKKRYKVFEQFYKDLKSTPQFNLISYHNTAFEIGMRKSGIIDFISKDGTIRLSMEMKWDNVVKLKFIFNSNKNGLGESVINRILNLCEKYEFHCDLYASPIHLTKEFEDVHRKTPNQYIYDRYAHMLTNPFIKKIYKKFLKNFGQYLKTCDRNVIDSLLGLHHYYKKFGFVALPFTLVGFLSEGRETIYTGHHMTWFHPNLDLQKTYPFYSEMCASQCGSTKRLFSWTESVEFVNWVIENKRFDLIGRNDDFYKAMLLMDTQIVEEYNTTDDEYIKEGLGKTLQKRNNNDGYSYSDTCHIMVRELINKGIDTIVNIRKVGIEIPKNFKGLKELQHNRNLFTSPDMLKGLVIPNG